ncbi:MAG: efflux RND transporter periplasmic adaptor subunit [Myxococcota bacterium]|nr:efflux RND transporter periplasmic adaptor subunit [Myxococcota bacterium]
MALKKKMIQKVPWFSAVIIGAAGFSTGFFFANKTETENKEPDEPAPDGEPAEENKEEETVWSCSMCPQVRSPEPGLCPICGMDLIPLSSADGTSDLPSEHVVLSDRAKILARIRTALVRQQDEPGVDVRLLGRIEPNESTYRSVTAWTGGRIDRLHVNATGQRIKKGQVIATLYSPEMFSAHQDLILAKKQLSALRAGTASSRSAADAALAAIQDRLRLLGVPNEDIARMAEAKSAWQQIPIRTPFSGTVLERIATEGAYVQTGAILYRVADLSSVWVQLDAYESDLPRLNVGQQVTLEVEGMATQGFKGKVGFIDPTLDPLRRTASVRVVIRNRKGKLRPGMFVQATVHGSAEKTVTKRPLLIPASAPIFTGRRSIVYVEVPDADAPTYEARVVRLGPLSQGFYPVIAGLRSQERVVEHGAFVLDADLQIRGGTSMMMSPDDKQIADWDDVVVMTPQERRAFRPLMAAYLKLQTALAKDNFEGAKRHARQLGQITRSTTIRRPNVATLRFREMSQMIRQHSEQLWRSESIGVARVDFENISANIEKLLQTFGNPMAFPVRQAYCPMAFNDQGASWIQKSDVIANAYYGAEMLLCGEIRETIAPNAYLKAPKRQAEAEATVQAKVAKGHHH